MFEQARPSPFKTWIESSSKSIETFIRATESILFDILHMVGNSLVTLLRTSKILVMDHDPSARRRGILLFESSLCSTRCGGGRDKLQKGGRYRPNNCIKR